MSRWLSEFEVVVPLWGVLACLAALLFLVLLWRRAASRIRRGLRRRGRRARQAERDAEQVLRRAGYRVTGRQVPVEWSMEVDGRPRRLSLRVDFIVQRWGRSYVAEVKSGSLVVRPDHPATRRQLLEYRLACPVDGVLLVDMERRKVHEVRFHGVRG